MRILRIKNRPHKKERSGVSIIEIIIVIAIFSVLGGIVTPFALRSYRDHILTSEARGFLNVLRRAESMAISNNGESNYGVKVNANDFVMFRGNSYDVRAAGFDESYLRETTVSISGLDEIIFFSPSGFPDATATIEFTNDTGRIISLDINEHGTIFW